MTIPQNIADSLNIRCMFFNRIEFAFDPPKEYGWVTQPFPVLATIVEGRGKITVARGAEIISIKENMSPCFLPAYVMRQPSATGHAPFSVLALGFSVEVLGGIGLLNFFNVPITFSERDIIRLNNLTANFSECSSTQKVLDLKQLAEQKKILFELLGVLVENAKPKADGIMLNTEMHGCLPAVAYLKNNFSSPIDIEQLCRMCHLSKSHFFRLFKCFTGVSPFTYLKDRRIEEAQKLLITTSCSVSEIGDLVGWHDQFHFSRTFKSRTGYSPMQFRKLNAVRMV